MPSSRRFTRVVLGAVALGIGFVGSPRVRAETPPRLQVYTASSESVARALDVRLRPRLRALGVDLLLGTTGAIDVGAVLGTRPAEGDQAPLAQVWLEGRSLTEATLFLVPRRADRVLARRIALGGGFDEVAFAEIVYIVERSVTALLASQPVGVPRDELDPALRGVGAAPVGVADAPSAVVPPPVALVPAEEPAPPSEAPPLVEPSPAPSPAPPESASPSPTAPRALAFHAGAFVGFSSWSDGQALVPDAGVLVGVESVRAWGRVGVVIDGGVHRQIAVTAVEGTLRLDGQEGHALFSLGRTFGEVGTARLLVGPGLVVSEVGATAAMGPTGATVRARTDFDAAVAAFVRWDAPLGASAGLFGLVGADVVLRAGRYTAIVDGEATTLLATWPVRPVVRVGVVFGGR